MLRKTLHCRACGWRTVSGRDDLIARLKLAGQLRRDNAPEDAIIEALLQVTLPRITCPGCKGIGLVSREADDEWEEDEDWQAVTLCEVCRQPVPPERVEALPGVKRCLACQGKAERGTLDEEEPDFCPKCGALVEIRVSRGSGLTRYKRFCTGSPPCRL